MKSRFMQRRTYCTALAVMAMGLAARQARATDFPEVEPNETKAQATANGIITLSPGDTLSGTTTGAVATPGATSIDNFHVKTAATAFGIYKYNLTLTSAVTGHTVTIRGLNQLTGVPGTTDSTIQTAQTVGTTRVSQWYDFGNQGELYYRVAGLATTTAPYSAALTRTPITPLTGPTNLLPGSITISTVGQTTSDTDMWVYDSLGNAIATFGNDDEPTPGTTLQSKLTRTFTSGDYYLAISNFSFTSNQASASDDRFRTGTLLDFPNAALNNSTTTAIVLNPKFTDAAGNTVVTVSKTTAFEVVWIKFTVAVPTVPSGVASFSPTPVAQGCNTTLSVVVTPAPSQPNNGITSVLADLTSINASLPNNFALTDGGSGTWTGTVSVPANTSTGAKIVNCTITDASARVGTCQASVTVNPYLVATGVAAPAAVPNGGSALLTATVNQAAGTCTLSTGITVTADLSTIGGSPTQAMADSGDGIHFTYNATVSATDGAKTLPVSASDAQGRTAATTIALQVGYCSATATTFTCGTDEYISNVTIGTINNNSVCGPGYENFSAQSTTVNPGGTAAISVTVSTWFSATDTVSVFCDWDQNTTLNDTGEVTALTDPGSHIYAGTISIPPGATLGATKMRVRLNFGASTNPCGNTTFGNVEDYTVIVSSSANPTVANPLAVPAGGHVGDLIQLTADVAQGTPPSAISTVTVNLTGMGGGAAVAMFDDGAHGDGGNLDGKWGVSATVLAGPTAGPKSLQVTATDALARTGTGNIAFYYCGFGQPPETFDGLAGLPPCGWVSVNDSPGGPGTNPNWGMTDGAATFPPHAGTGFVFANYNTSTGTNDVSNYLMSPVIPAMKNGDHVIFWTRCPTASTFPDRMSLMISTNGASVAPADFQANPAQVTINPTLVAGGYPEVWTQFDVVLSGITGTVSGRIAFWYNVTAGGPSGLFSDYVGVDDVEYVVGAVTCACNGDINADTLVNGSDITGFAACVISAGGAGCGCADMNHDAAVSVTDIPGFITAVLAGGCGP